MFEKRSSAHLTSVRLALSCSLAGVLANPAPGTSQTMELTVIVPDGIVSGVFEPEGLVRATLRRPGEDAQSVEVAADRDGIFQFTCELFRCRELRPGDAVLVEAGRRETVVGPLGDLDWDVDLGKNEVHGSLEAPKLSKSNRGPMSGSGRPRPASGYPDSGSKGRGLRMRFR